MRNYLTLDASDFSIRIFLSGLANAHHGCLGVFPVGLYSTLRIPSSETVESVMEVSAASLSLPGFDLYQVTRVWVELGLAVLVFSSRGSAFEALFY